MKAELLILGVLHRGNFHPYEIKRRLGNAMLECFTDVDVGTLYYAVRQLAKNGLIKPASQQRVLRGGIKTTYKITTTGRQRFQTLLHDCFAAAGSVADTLYVAMLFLHLCDAPRVAALLTDKIARQRAAISELAAIHKRFSPVLGTGASHLIKHLAAQRRLDLKWLQNLHVDVAAGKLRDLPDPARLAAPRK
jgi:DNA-binding PadR family transcriptional regulator